jgi:hypothetical protein
MSVTHPKPRISERSRGRGESDHVASPFDVGFSNFEFDGLKPSSTSTSIVLLDHTWVGMPEARPIEATTSTQSIAGKTYVKLNDGGGERIIDAGRA